MLRRSWARKRASLNFYVGLAMPGVAAPHLAWPIQHIKRDCDLWVASPLIERELSKANFQNN